MVHDTTVTVVAPDPEGKVPETPVEQTLATGSLPRREATPLPQTAVVSNELTVDVVAATNQLSSGQRRLVAGQELSYSTPFNGAAAPLASGAPAQKTERDTKKTPAGLESLLLLASTVETVTSMEEESVAAATRTEAGSAERVPEPTKARKAIENTPVVHSETASPVKSEENVNHSTQTTLAVEAEQQSPPAMKAAAEKTIDTSTDPVLASVSTMETNNTNKTLETPLRLEPSLVEPSPSPEKPVRKRRLQSEVEDFNREDKKKNPRQCSVYKLTEKDLETTSLAKYVSKIIDERAGLAKLQFPENHFQFQYESWDEQDLTFESPIKQHIQGIGGIYEYVLADIKPMTLSDFKKHDDKLLTVKQREKKIPDLIRYFWKRLSPVMPPSVYGADQPGTLFQEDEWGLGNLDSCLKLLTSNIPGVTDPYLYAGTFGSVFCAHTEDLDLLSINYLHGGAPKVWYAVPMKDSQRFRNLAEHHYPHLSHTCPEFLRHKQCLLSPKILEKAGIPYQTTVQYPGEAVVTFPGSYHFGFNLGFNLAEATNFGIPEWIAIGKQASVCLCRPDSVRIDMGRLEELNTYYQEAIIRNHRMSYSEWRKRFVKKTQKPVTKPKKRKRIKQPSEQQKKKEFWIHVVDKTNPDLWHLAQPTKRRLCAGTKILYLMQNGSDEDCHRGKILDVQDDHYKIHLEGFSKSSDMWLPTNHPKIYLDGGAYQEEASSLPTLHYWQEMDSVKRQEEA